MDRIIILGTANAVSDESHENSHLIMQSSSRVVLVDCPGNPIIRIKKAGIDPLFITDLILTHFHPDHVAGLPLFLMDLWLMGRTEPLSIYGLEHTIGRAEKMMQLFEWNRWPDFFPVKFKLVDEDPYFLLMEDQSIKIQSSPVKHLIPTIGIRVLFKNDNKVFVYTSDTEPCQEVLDLAQSADILLHESAGQSVGHSSAEQCGLTAEKAGVKNLYLTHYNTETKPVKLRKLAKSTFSGNVVVAKDLLAISFD